MKWRNYSIQFISTPGHSKGSICFLIENKLFSGDTLMQSKPFINKRNGSMEEYKNSLNILNMLIKGKNITIYPGHGDTFKI